MKIFTEPKKLQKWCRAQGKAGKKIALVPTMGYLHEGHLSLIERAGATAMMPSYLSLRIMARSSAVKSGLFNFVKSLALAGGPCGVRAVCVSPGPVLTRPGMSTMATVRGTAAQPDELVNAILYLCSDAASFVTGTNILVDGGHMCVPAASV